MQPAFELTRFRCPGHDAPSPLSGQLAVIGGLASRRAVLLACAFMLQPVMHATAQGLSHRIGLLANASPQPKFPAPVDALRDALRELGYIEGQTLKIEYRWAEGNSARLPGLASDLVASGVELIVASGDAPIRAAMAATRTIPIVMATSGDAVGSGFIASLARPGGNVTGMTAINPELGAKRLQLLRELLPNSSRVAILWNPDDGSHRLDLKSTQEAAPRLGLALSAFELRSVGDIDETFNRMVRQKVGALLVFNDSVSVAARPRILELAALHRLPSMYEAREWAAAGGLIAYGVTHVDLFRESAHFVDKIIRGATPAELPVEQPTRLRLTINRATAKALGLALPNGLLVRADELVGD